MTTQTAQITIEMLDALNEGKHDLPQIRKVRRILELAGLQVALHSLEQREVDRLRQASVRFALEADEIEARGVAS